MSFNLTAPINQLGFGICGLNVLLALEKAGKEPALWPIGPVEAPDNTYEVIERSLDRSGFPLRNRRSKKDENAKMFDRRSPSLRIWHQHDLAQHVGKGPHCAYPFFELNRFRENEIHHLLSQDIVFASSQWAAEVLADNNVPESCIEYAPCGVDLDIFSPKSSAEHTTTFINVGKWEVRKNQSALAEAFRKAFSPSDDVRLILNCSNPFLTEKEHGDWCNLFWRGPMASKVEILPHRLATQRDVAQLMARADCGVFPSRAEGWNLELGEMLAMGKHCICTNYSAHTEFATEENCRLISIDSLEDAYDGKWFFGHGQWAAFGPSQMEQLVEHLRDVHKRKQEGSLGVNQAGIDTMNRFTWANTVQEILSVL